MKYLFKRILRAFNSRFSSLKQYAGVFSRRWQICRFFSFNSLRYYFLASVIALTQIVVLSYFSKQKVAAQTQNLCPAGNVPTPVQWRPAVGAPAIAAQTINVGEVAVNFSFAESLPGQVIDNVETRIDNDVYGGIPGPNLRFNIGLEKTPSPGNATLSINFSRPVIIASPLTLLDVDRDGERDIGFTYQDRVTVSAFNGDVPVGVTLRSLTPNTRVTGNTVVGINENSFPDRPDANVSVTPAGQLNRLDFLYEPGTEFGQPLQDETIGLARFSICLPAPPGATIGDTVFNDRNANRVQDEGEPGIGNVTLILRNSRGQEVRRTTTNSNGIYSFLNLPLGNYTIEALRPNDDFNPTTNTTLAANLTEPNQELLTVDFGFTTNRVGGAGTPNIRLIKRITNAIRNGQSITGTNFNTFVPDPNNDNDDVLPSAERFRGVSILEVPVQSRDEIEYTIYFLAEGDGIANNVRFCDLVPNGTTFVSNSINISGAGNGADNGRYLSPLTPLEQSFTNICPGNNNNGAVVANLGNISSGNFGFVSFRTAIN
ncbi:MAG: carboxypeptidase regulatory-like domain-containing protein [Calothrix sp. C42_A2020_038]|nr:carboxypeptidase regulatory-like domain-containing protein [Calothrix sp. C42_A2020_038]